MKQARRKNKLGKYNPETDSIIISVKEARKILGKEMSDKLSDEDLARVIGATKKEPNGSNSDGMVTLADSKWNDLVSDMYRSKKLISVILYQNTSSTSVV